jgi:hypothetical protein
MQVSDDLHEHGEKGNRGRRGREGRQGEAGKDAIHPWRWRALTLWIILFTAFSFWQYTALQDSRVSSCKRTYEGIRLVFQPFLPPEEAATPQQVRNIEKFNNRITVLKANCDKQTEVK